MPKRKRSYSMRRRRPTKRRRRTYKSKRRKFTGRRKLTRRGGINPKNVVFPNYKRLSAKWALSNVLEGTVPIVTPGDNTVVVKFPGTLNNISMTSCFERNVYSGGSPVVNPSVTALMDAYEQYRVRAIRGKVYLTNLTDVTADTNLECVLDTGFSTAQGTPPASTYDKSINDTIMMGGGKIIICPSSTGSNNRRVVSFSRSNKGVQQRSDGGGSGQEALDSWYPTNSITALGQTAWMRCEITAQDPTLQAKCHARLVVWVDYEFKDPVPIEIANNDPEDI